MKLALLGFPIKHSLSPSLYHDILGEQLERYDLLEIQDPAAVPSLKELSLKYAGLNITTPHKTHFLKEVKLHSELVEKIGAINTIAFSPKGAVGTNTDVLAVELILQRHLQANPKLEIVLLGSGVMARVTQLVAAELGISLRQFSRSQGHQLQNLDLTTQGISRNSLIINACSRDFVFQGKLPRDSVFWDYNYAFIPHQTTLPSQVASYEDGKELLKLQALAAVAFWEEMTP